MHSMVKNVFIIVGTMMVSVLVFTVVMGDTGRAFMWRAMEPVFQTNWQMNTFDDGALISEQLTANFEESVEIHDNSDNVTAPVEQPREPVQPPYTPPVQTPTVPPRETPKEPVQPPYKPPVQPPKQPVENPKEVTKPVEQPKKPIEKPITDPIKSKK